MSLNQLPRGNIIRLNKEKTKFIDIIDNFSFEYLSRNSLKKSDNNRISKISQFKNNEIDSDANNRGSIIKSYKLNEEKDFDQEEPEDDKKIKRKITKKETISNETNSGKMFNDLTSVPSKIHNVNYNSDDNSNIKLLQGLNENSKDKFVVE